MSRDNEVDEVIKQSRKTLSKTLFALSRCRIAEDDSSGDLLSQSQVCMTDHDEVGLPTQ
jgi:hypothetical protein